MTVALLLDSDTLSEIARGHRRANEMARAYLSEHGRLTFSAVTVFERLRGYREALRRGRPYEEHLKQFERLVEASIVLPFDAAAADRASHLWADSSPRGRKSLGDLMIAATAWANGIVLVTRNRKDYAQFVKVAAGALQLSNWT